ncbi:hypothetical protein HPB51_016546 [Rhipicephalus microplus]|uniref:Uncharacterized protein n=1 Tax=Rhipicephalus microplus TaxID=6941 RepID=A0A9J6EH71_RHIMP|nr:hypothetical protein HPB51_016546 [Rhipicephalus microplus]
MQLTSIQRRRRDWRWQESRERHRRAQESCCQSLEDAPAARGASQDYNPTMGRTEFEQMSRVSSPEPAREPHLHSHVQVPWRRPPHRRQNVEEVVASTLFGTGPPMGTRPVAISHEGAHGDVKPTKEPQKLLTLSKLLPIQTPLATQEEQPLQVERSAGELRIRSAWCHAGGWDNLGR